MYGVFIDRGDWHDFIRVFEHEIDAADFCDVRDWELVDDDGVRWKLDYCEV